MKVVRRIKPAKSGARTAAIVPPHSIAGRSLVVVLAIMCFLAGLTVAAVTLVVETAGAWQAGIAREMTIQVRPLDGIDVNAEVEKAATLARDVPGMGAVRVLSKKDNDALVAIWLGTDAGLDALPIPRLIVLEKPPAGLDVANLRDRLVQTVKGASLDDHREWRARLAVMTGSLVAIGVIIVVLVLVATALSVIFSTRAAMASNRAIVDVLHLVGAQDAFIARTFQRRFLHLGLEGGLYGGLAALAAFPLVQFLIRLLFGAAGEAQVRALVGTTTLTPTAALAIVITLVAIAAMTAITSRLTVQHFLKAEG